MKKCNKNTSSDLKKGLSNVKITPVPIIIKWTGSKRISANEINSYFPNYNRYFEPFLGGGSLLYLNCHRPAIASDIYEPLIKLWILVRDNSDLVIKSYKDNWIKLQKKLPDYYYEVRARFNKYHDPLDLLFLSRTCVTGIIRFNKTGEFNNSFHLSRKGIEPSKFSKIAQLWSYKIKGIIFRCVDYKIIFDETKKGDFIYLDPPYAANKQRYIANLNTKEFFDCLRIINSKGVKYALSFDGLRDNVDFKTPFPNDLFKRHIFIYSGLSAVKKVLNGQTKRVTESLYLNY